MITFRKLNIKDSKYFLKLIFTEEDNFNEFLKMGWSANQINSQINKKVNLSYGAFYNDSLISFILGDLFHIEKISEYEILLLYVCLPFRNRGLGEKLLKKIEKNNNNLKKIYLEVSRNNIEGISFYKKMNFHNMYIRKNYFFINNKKIDALVLSKDL